LVVEADKFDGNGRRRLRFWRPPNEDDKKLIMQDPMAKKVYEESLKTQK